jgi:hypothetical protein
VGRDTRAVTPYSWSWNIGFQHEIARNTTLEVDYVGTASKNQLKFYDVNQVGSGDVNNNGVPDRLDYARAGAGDDVSGLRPYGVFGNAGITIWGHDGSATYHSLQTQFTSRFGSRGSQFQASYTWSKSLGDIPLDDSGGISSDNSVTDLNNPGLDRGPTRTNRKHIFNASLVLALPTMEGHSGFVKHVLGDWEIASIVAAASGQSISVYANVPDLNGGGPSGTGYASNQRPNVVPGVSCRATGGLPEQILNPAAFTLTDFQLGTIGNAGRGICEGPGLFQTDLSLYKNIKLNQKVRLQLRFEVFNIFDNVNFLGGSGTFNNTMSVTNPTFDTGNSATATRITGYTVPSTFGQATATRDPRQAQFGIKLIF